jgi:hypothetical protein
LFLTSAPLLLEEVRSGTPERSGADRPRRMRGHFPGWPPSRCATGVWKVTRGFMRPEGGSADCP